MRKLASIQRIKNLEIIPGADAIVKATVLGWQLVVKKDEFAVGDLCVYVEIDSVLPERMEFEFLRNKNYRIKTIRLRGQISQGICFPLALLPENLKIEEDADVSEMLGIVKYEPPVPAALAGIMKGNFPSFIPKTDETRIQVMQHELDKYKGSDCYITEKLDGTSVTFYMKDDVFGVCSRNMELEENEASSYWKMAKQMNIETILRSLDMNVALQGEMVGEGIQGNKLKIKGQKVFFFNLFWIDEYRYANYNEWKEIITQGLGLETVPVMNDDYKLDNNINCLLEMAEINSTINPAVMAEGLVIRVKEDKELVSFKTISNKFLLKYGE